MSASILRAVWRGRFAAAAPLALLMLVFAGAAAGQDQWPPPRPPHGGPPGGPPHHRGGPPPLEHVLERNAERLGLDAATEAEIRAISSASRAEGERIRESLDAAHREMRALLSADAPDESAVMQQVERIGALETEAHKSRLRGMLQIRALLTPEQRAVLVEIHKERRARRGERRGGPRRRDELPAPEPHGVE
jgi:Spy/CpxP family protein refolding chaperone